MSVIKILIADDEEKIVKIVSDFLKNAGYDVLCAYDGKEALRIFSENENEISLAIIDIMMPEINGWQLTEKIREKSQIPIIMLSARSEDFDMLAGFEAGIDEYVTKPFSPAVLIKRVEVLLKRSNLNGSTVPDIKSGLFIDEAAYTAFVDGNQLDLTLKEFEILLYLSKNKGIVLTRDRLLDAVWGYDYFGDSRTVDSHIARLRAKLGEYGAKHLKTIYGMGYKLDV